MLAAQAGSPTSVVRPSAGKNNPPPPAPTSGNFSFYKAVEQKNADTKLATPDAQSQPAATPADPAKTDDKLPLPPLHQLLLRPGRRRHPPGRRRRPRRSPEEKAVSCLLRQQPLRRQILPSPGRSLRRHQRRRTDPRPSRRGWVQSNSEEVDLYLQFHERLGLAEGRQLQITNHQLQIPRVPLLFPRIPVHVISVALPEPRRVVIKKFKTAHPLHRLPRIKMRHNQPRRITHDPDSSGSPS